MPTSQNEDPINCPITVDELNHTLALSNNSSPGPDDIPNSLIKNMPDLGIDEEICKAFANQLHVILVSMDLEKAYEMVPAAIQACIDLGLKEYYSGESNNFQSVPSLGNHIIVYKGHYNVPSFDDQKLIGPSKEAVPIDSACPDGPNMIPLGISDEKAEKAKKEEIAKKTWSGWLRRNYETVKNAINQQENKGLKLSLIIMTGCVIAMFWYLQIQ
ncbi:unnamed protein product, partial [Callosobruchus maculatus]